MNVINTHDLYIQKIADVTHIPFPYILQMRDIGIMDQRAARNMLIKHDYIKLSAFGKYTRKQILEKLSGIYGVDKYRVQYIVNDKPKHIYHCAMCGSQIMKSEYMRNDGICNGCVSEQINL